ncbi:Mycobacterium numidiamassiliense ORFan [Mycobacterium numidiamassiliense]|uniref:Mycobacterium numidiamassiliense ORFan n=1 Tax=Mycobacterium numidiamassiliense TaxID=1841861 RepID=A0A2U3PFD0_9MYCO|nr:Mycobacterium numidiamassiliense ORFan [Mycobacterium numidiamassiliense]
MGQRNRTSEEGQRNIAINEREVQPITYCHMPFSVLAPRASADSDSTVS